MLSHVDKTILAMDQKQIQNARNEIMKKSKTIKTKFGDLIVIRHRKLNTCGKGILSE